MAYAEDEPEPERRSFMFRGHDLSKVPCFRSSMMYAIGSGMGVGVAYTLATSRSPYSLAFAAYTLVLFGSWFQCRYEYRQSEHQLKLIREAIERRHTIEGTEKDSIWAARAREKSGLRSDINEEEA